MCASPAARSAWPTGRPTGFIGQLFKTIGQHVKPPAGIESPALWGSRPRIDELFGAQAAAIDVTARQFNFRYRSPEHMVEIFKTFYGPVLKAFAALDAAAQPKLAADLMALIGRFNRAQDGTMVAPSDYLEIVITKK